MIILKILIFLAALLLLALPFLPLRRWPVTFSYYRKEGDKSFRNHINVICVFVAGVIGIVILPWLRDLAAKIGNLKPFVWLASKLSTYARYTTDLVVLIVVNIFLCLLALCILAFVNSSIGVAQWIRKHFAKLKPKNAESGKKSKSGKAQKKVAAPKKNQVTLAPELLPEPEEAPTGSRIILPGEKSVKADRKKTVTPAKTAAEKKNNAEGILQRIGTWLRSVFYEEVDQSWYVRPQMRHVAKHLRNFLVLVFAIYLASFALLLLPALFHIQFLEEFLYKIMRILLSINYLYPSIALALLTEIFWLLNGKAAPVEATEPEEDPSYKQAGRVVDLDRLEEDLNKTLGKYYEFSSFYSDDIDTAQFDRTVVDLQASPALRDIADFVQSQGLELNQEYLLGIKYFQEGRNVLFHAPLYTAVGPYLFAALNLRITQGERLVVVCHNKSEIPNIISSMQSGFLRVTRTHKPLWRIVSMEDLSLNDDVDILVITPEELQDEKLLVVYEAFFRQVTVALFPDANLVVSANNYYCQIVSQCLTQNCKKGLQFIFLSTRNTENLDNYLTEYFLLPQSPENARGDYGFGDAHIYVWRAKRDAADVIDNAGQTMLPEVTIGNIASQNGVPRPSVISDGAIYSNQVSTEWLELYDSSERPLGFAVVSDDCCNLPGVIYAYSRYLGKKASVIHVLTRQYLLRNYFFAHASRYLFEEPLMQRSMTEHAEPGKTQMVLLLCRLIQGLPLSSFVSEMQRILGKKPAYSGETVSFDSIAALVNQCLAVSTGMPPSDTQEHFNIYIPRDEFYPEPHIRIQEGGKVLSQLLTETALVQIHFEGVREPEYMNLFARMVNQRYLPEQNLVYKNRNYRILRVDGENGTIFVSDASSSHGLAREYIQIRNYAIEGGSTFQTDCERISQRKKPESDKIHGTRIDFAGDGKTVSGLILAQSCDAFRVTSDTMGYYMLNSDNGTVRVTDQTIPVVWLHEGQRDALRREVGTGLYLKIEMKRNRDDRLTMTLAALLQELMKTLFPDVYFCLSVCPILEDPDLVCRSDDFKSQTIFSLYPQLRNWGPVSENSIELLIVEDCVGGTGAMELLFEENATYLRNALWMLHEYLEWQKDNEPSPYIFFGMDTQPDIFDLDGLRAVLQGFARKYVREHDVHSQIDAANRCTLCGKKAVDPFLWNEKHMICRECSEAYVPDCDEATQIMEYAKQYLEESFGITLPEVQVQIEQQISGEELSALNLEQKLLLLAENLPLRVVHVQIVTQLVRLWQLTNLEINGDPLLVGQPLYVTLQYLRYLRQHQYAKLLHREYFSREDEAGYGYRTLAQALQLEGHDNSFLHLRHHCKGRSETPPKPPVAKPSTRALSDRDVGHYFRTLLTTEECAVYDALYNGFMNHDAEIDLKSCAISSEAFERIHTCVIRDHPEVFWSDGRVEWTHDEGEIVNSASPKYTLTKAERSQIQEEIDAAATPFLSEITDDMSDYDVALKLYEKLIEYLDYDTISLERQKKLSQTQRSETMDVLRNVYGALVKHRAVCTGYAKAYQYLLQKCGIEALTVSGDCFEGGGHAWNIVCLEGDYYHVDVTWGDSSDTDPSKDRDGMSYAYFAVTDAQIQRTRSVDAEPKLPKCLSENCNYYVRNGLYFTRYDPNEVREILVEKMKDPKTTFVELRFENTGLLREAAYFLCQNGGVFEAAQKAGRELPRFSHSTLEDMRLLRIIFG